MKSDKLRRCFVKVLFWTPADLLHSTAGHANISALFRKFQQNEQFLQLKIILTGVITFVTVLGITSLFLQTTDYDLPWVAETVLFCSLAAVVIHVLLAALALSGRYFRRLTIFHRSWFFAAISYIPIFLLMSSIVFTGRMFNGRLFLASTSLMYIIATVYFQEFFLVSDLIWLTIFSNGVAYLFVHPQTKVNQVSLVLVASIIIMGVLTARYACMHDYDR